MGIRGEPNPTDFTRAIQARRESLPVVRTEKSRRAVAKALGISESTYQMAELGYSPIAEYSDAILDHLFSTDPSSPKYDPEERRRIEGLMQEHEKPIPSADEVIERIVNALNARLGPDDHPYPIIRFSKLLKALREEADMTLQMTGHVTEFGNAENENYSGGSTHLPLANTLIQSIKQNGIVSFPNGLDQQLYLTGLATIARQERRADELPDALWAWRSWGGEKNGEKWTPRMGRIPLSQQFQVSEMSIRDIECEGHPPSRMWADRLRAYFSQSYGLGEFTLPEDIIPPALPMDEDTFLDIGKQLAARLRRNYDIDRTRESANHPEALAFGRKVKALRDTLGISQLDLGNLLPDNGDATDYVIKARVSNVELGNFKNPLSVDEKKAFYHAFGLTEAQFNAYGLAAQKVMLIRDRSFMPAVTRVLENQGVSQREFARDSNLDRSLIGSLMATTRRAASIHGAHVDTITETMIRTMDVLKQDKYKHLTTEAAIYAEAGYIRLYDNGTIDSTSFPFRANGTECPLINEDFMVVAEYRQAFIATHDQLFNLDGSVVNNTGAPHQHTRSHRGKAVKRGRT